MARLVGARSILFMGRRLRRYTSIFGPKWFTPSNGLVRDHDAAFRAMIAVTLIVASGIANAGFRVAGSFGKLFYTDGRETAKRVSQTNTRNFFLKGKALLNRKAMQATAARIRRARIKATIRQTRQASEAKARAKAAHDKVLLTPIAVFCCSTVADGCGRFGWPSTWAQMAL